MVTEEKPAVVPPASPPCLVLSTDDAVSPTSLGSDDQNFLLTSSTISPPTSLSSRNIHLQRPGTQVQISDPKSLPLPPIVSPKDRLVGNFLSRTASAQSFRILSTTFLKEAAEKDRNAIVQLKEDGQINGIVKHQLGFRSRRGADPVTTTKPRKNQDAYFICSNLGIDGGMNVFAVLDGHGPFGHKAARVAAKIMIERIKANAKTLFNDPVGLLRLSFEETELQLELRAGNYIQNSGSTCVLALQIDHRLYIANVGDSRCFMGTVGVDSPANADDKSEGSLYYSVQLTKDHTPRIKNEKDRILREGGVIDEYAVNSDESISRVRNPNKVRRAGLAMSRSLGDMMFKEIGVIADPEIHLQFLDASVSYLLLASDGVHGVLSAEEMTKIICDNHDENAQHVADAIVEYAANKWQSEDSEMDDITVIFSWLTVDTSNDERETLGAAILPVDGKSSRRRNKDLLCSPTGKDALRNQQERWSTGVTERADLRPDLWARYSALKNKSLQQMPFRRKPSEPRTDKT
mmetsp:Transcript_2220/g.6612  ORF Transcript_2220/g.6612 Transcript_2220/m.6612 type:complete len:519 (-) Transcript_2220:1556-3112(-)|eukprot:CAMPEP_0198734508 /NCGR_PEP_ID=MMETSP1475-20131203/53208_1 /TAXON_ID= ORGANISM="Unidentified sp., Strain CCMP1999" /NCGR_SAMPLE_ID=MMETSP1475 /ASSEMBLY_ACC=CAM_ASM_001111 /LENGTH=518 /DNA_ID=CAMNT_0044497995 /DNA_START=719 /DNA_END=2275 /DNA_ORIENTATION=-